MATELEESNKRGRGAERPSSIPGRGWKDILWRVWGSISRNRVPLIAAGTAFYLLLAIFPAIAALVSIYGLFADPSTIQAHIDLLRGVVPVEGMEIIERQLATFTEQDTGSFGLAFVIGLAVSIWFANNGIRTLFQAMNIAYEEREKRGTVRLILTSLAATVCGILFVIVVLVLIGITPAILAAVRLNSLTDTLISVLRWPVLLILAAIGISLLHRYGPSRNPAKWRWISWGSVGGALAWVLVSLAFSWYLENFGNYDATYGSLGAVVGLMIWFWISCLILIVSAVVNAEIEHQTMKDTTIPPDRPLGERGAVMADTVGKATK